MIISFSPEAYASNDSSAEDSVSRVKDIDSQIKSLQTEKKALMECVDGLVNKHGLVLGYDDKPLAIRNITDVNRFDSSSFKKENPSMYRDYIVLSQRVSWSFL